MASVTFDHVSKRYDSDVAAVDDLQLEIADGEFLVLVGPSGCGKSTALRMVAGLERISEGRILIGDRVVNNVAPMSRDVAMVFQSYALYPHMTVYDNLAFGLRNHRVPKPEIQRRVHEAAEVFVNGKSAGFIFMPPYSVDISGLLRPGRNEIKVTVGNLPINRFLGLPDQDLRPLRAAYGNRFPYPQEKRVVKEPAVSGLVGRVWLETTK